MSQPIASGTAAAGFAGTLWACWQQYVANKVVGLAYRDFHAVLAVNPALAADGRFVAEQRYNLPRNVGQTDYELVTPPARTGVLVLKNCRRATIASR